MSHKRGTGKEAFYRVQAFQNGNGIHNIWYYGTPDDIKKLPDGINIGDWAFDKARMRYFHLITDQMFETKPYTLIRFEAFSHASGKYETMFESRNILS